MFFFEFYSLDFSFAAGDFHFCAVVHIESGKRHQDSTDVSIFNRTRWGGGGEGGPGVLGKYPNAWTRVVRWPNQIMLMTMTKMRFTRPAMLYATGDATLNNEKAMIF